MMVLRGKTCCDWPTGEGKLVYSMESQVDLLSRVPQPPVPLLKASCDIRIGKIKVILRVSEGEDPDRSILTLDEKRKRVTLTQASSVGQTSTVSTASAIGVNAPKTFTFDALFSCHHPLHDICISSLVEVIRGVLSGTNGCVITIGHSSAERLDLLGGRGEEPGVLASVVSWLFTCLHERSKTRTGSKVTVKVSAIQILGDAVHDLLASPLHGGGDLEKEGYKGVECPGPGTWKEFLAVDSISAARFLDHALNTITEIRRGQKDDASSFLFIFRLHQFHDEQVGGGKLFIMDLGTGKMKGKAGPMPNILLEIANGPRDPKLRESLVGGLLGGSLGSLTCQASVLAHVSSDPDRYSETLCLIQSASRIHRVRRYPRLKPLGGCKGLDHGEGVGSGSTSEIDPSSSELSADTVIYMGGNGEDDEEGTDSEHPPSSEGQRPLQAVEGASTTSLASSWSDKEKDKDNDPSPPPPPPRLGAGGGGRSLPATPMRRKPETMVYGTPRRGKRVSSDEQWVASQGGSVTRETWVDTVDVMLEKKKTWEEMKKKEKLAMKREKKRKRRREEGEEGRASGTGTSSSGFVSGPRPVVPGKEDEEDEVASPLNPGKDHDHHASVS
ncbi:unnamed protein product [Darwinula stevensoni]|uniref:Kinesin motor domain-containing protein n=1 Tax=Darwinula stevensoni TaxID=69355 RepID=A0A7R9A4T9_9CRUS|nr:unnamed protein product [Darwinula stevensoni]CAG0893216.1 unnamed protein product [Darwinula stevensoni]